MFDNLKKMFMAWASRQFVEFLFSPRKKSRRHKTSTDLETYSIKNDNDRPLDWLPWLACVSQGLLVHQRMITIDIVDGSEIFQQPP